MIRLQGDHTSMAMCLLAGYTLDDSVKLLYGCYQWFQLPGCRVSVKLE